MKQAVENLKSFPTEEQETSYFTLVKAQCYIIHPVSSQCTSFSFQFNRTNHAWDMANRVFDLEKTHILNFEKKKFTQKKFRTEFLQYLIR